MEHRIEAVVPVRPAATINQRVGDLERSAACDELAAHFAAGRLTGEELNQRLEVAMTAQTVRELRLLLVDLPVAGPPNHPAPGHAPPPGPRADWSAFDALVLVALLGSVVMIGVMMLGLAASGEVVIFLFAAVGGSLAAMAGACLLHLVHRAQHGFVCGRV